MESGTVFWGALGVVQAYFLGAVPFGFILVKLVKGIDVRTVGSGNIGATNVGRAAGVRIGILSLALDIAKGFVAVTWIPFAVFAIASSHYQYSTLLAFVKEAMGGGGWSDLRMLCGLAAIIGHTWTIFLKFKGGKGVATALGVFLGLAPLPTVAALVVWVIVTRVSGYVSLGSIVAAAVLPVAVFVFEYERIASGWRLVALTAAISAIVIVRHGSNIRRLLDGTEARFNFAHRRIEHSTEPPGQSDGT